MIDGEVTYYPGIGSAQDDAPTWGDYAKTAGAGVVGAGAQLAAGARAATDESPTDEGHVVNGMATALQGYLNHATDNIEGSRSESAKRLAASAVTSREFWDHPVSAGALKLAGMSGPAAAMIFSGGPIGAAIVNGSLTAGSYLNDVDKMLDGMSAGDLEQNKYYSTLRSMGMDESEARLGLKKKLVDNKVMYNFLAGAAAGAIGPAGKLAAGVSGKAAAGLAGAETGVAARAALGGAEGAAGGALQGGVANTTLQNTEIEAGAKKTFDEEALVNAVLEPAALGGVMGAAAGAAVKPKSKSKTTPEKTTDAVQVADQGPQEQGSGAKDAPVEAAGPVATQATPDSGSPAQSPVAPGAKGEAIKAKGKKKGAKNIAPEMTIVEAGTPSPAETLAIADKQQKVLPKTPEIAPEVPPEVAAASTRIAQPEHVEPPTAPAESPQVPPEVAAASKRVTSPEPKPVTPEVTAPEQAPVSSVAPASEAPPEVAKRAPRVLRNLTEDGLSPEEVAPAKIEPLAEPKVDDAGNKVVPGRNMGPKAREKVSAHRAASDTIVEAHPATEAETNYFSDKPAQAAVVARAKAMVAAADAAEHKIPAQIKESVNKDQITDHPNTQLLVYARDLVRAAKSKASGTKIPEAVARFKERESGVKSGNAAGEVSTRKAEGDMAMRRDQGDAGERGATTDTPESILAAKDAPEGEAISSAEAQDEAKAKAAAGSIDAEKNAVETSVAKSAKGTVRGIDDATEKRTVTAKDGTKKEVEATKAAGEVKKVSASDDMKAKYAAMLEKASKKTGYLDAALTNKNTPKDAATGEPVKVLHTTTAAKALAALDLSHLSGVPRALADFAKRRLAAMAGDTPVHTLDKAEMARATGDLSTAFAEDGHGNIGMHRLNLAGEGGQVLLRHDALREPAQTAHVVLHEVAHAATMRALVENPIIHGHVVDMMGEVKAFMKGLPADMTGKMEYAMSNPREFIAEAFSNPDVQEILAHIPVSDALARALRLEKTQRLSVWDAIVNVVRGIIEKSTGRLPEGHRMIEAVMRVSDHIAKENETTALAERATGGPLPIEQHGLSDAHLDSALTVKEAGDRAADKLVNIKGAARRLANRVSFNTSLADTHKDLSGPGLGKIVSEQAKKAAMRDKILETNGGRELVARNAELERTNPEGMAKGADLAFDASAHELNLGPNAVNDFGVDNTSRWQAKGMLAELQKRYNALSPEIQEHLQKTAAFFKRVHDEVSMDTIKNVLKVADINEPGLAERIFKDGLTDADKEKFGEKSGIVSALNDATNLKELKGWYVPFRRYGDFISTGEHELSVPKNGTKINDNTIQFYDDGKDAAVRRQAEAYVNQKEHTPQGNKLINSGIDRVYVDANDPTKLTDDKDVNGKVAYRARMQTQHTEFHDTEADAKRNEDALKEAGLQNTNTHKREEAHRATPGMEGALGTVIRSLEHTESYKKLNPTQQAAVRQSLADASVRSMSSTNIKTSMAHRRNVAGMSRDLGRVTADYARMSANHLANLKFGPGIAEGFAQMREHIKDYASDKNTIQREEVYQEMHNRVYGKASMLADRAPNPVIRKLLQVSRSARLAGVSFHLINSMEPLTTSLPWIAGRHGPVQTTKAILKAYNTIGGLGAIRAGLADTVRAYTRENGFTDYVQMFKDNIAKSNAMGGTHSKFLMDTLDYANERGLWGNDAIFEVGKSADPTGNVASRALDRIDLMANQVGSAVEANNRAVTLLAAAQLEFKKNGGNHTAAMDYAYQAAVTTMGDYSSWNASPLFNSRGGQMALQFKKFAVKSYTMLGKSIAGTIRGDPESAKQLIGLMVTHAAVAGALGLPGLEPFKVALMAANAFGITGYDPGDFENDVRELTARVFGKKGGEIFSHGVFRGAGIEVSNRMGWDNLLTYGNPKTNKPNDIKAWLWDTMAGAPAGYILDQFAAGQALMKGDLATAVQKASPIRAVSDIAKAYSGAAGPKLGPSGREQHEALTPYQTGLRAIGLTPSVTAEDGAMRGHVASEGKQLSADRTSLMNAWVNGSGAAKVSAQRAIQKWNQGQPKDAQISAKDLASAAKRRDNEDDNAGAKSGIHVSKRTKAIYDRATSTYNP